ncbi:MAG: hypothetical protein GY941_15825 [Planctomycetes bacterium]|nr:hypothetical protein [Planctomycetota bacterium]
MTKRTNKRKPRNDILIEVTITTPDGSALAKSLTIHNPSGCILKPKINDPQDVYNNLISGMAAKYGAKHIK